VIARVALVAALVAAAAVSAGAQAPADDVPRLVVEAGEQRASGRPLVCRSGDPCPRIAPPPLRPALAVRGRPRITVSARLPATAVTVRRRRGGRLVGRVIGKEPSRGRFRIELPALREREELLYVRVVYEDGRIGQAQLTLRRARRS
jgi:hypothetical protein